LEINVFEGIQVHLGEIGQWGELEVVQVALGDLLELFGYFAHVKAHGTLIFLGHSEFFVE
jgi:hypothetical protein